MIDSFGKNSRALLLAAAAMAVSTQGIAGEEKSPSLDELRRGMNFEYVPGGGDPLRPPEAAKAPEPEPESEPETEVEVAAPPEKPVEPEPAAEAKAEAKAEETKAEVDMAAIFQEFEDMKIQVEGVFVQDGERKALVGDRIYSMGDLVGDAVVNAIEPNAVMFDYRGILFRVPVYAENPNSASTSIAAPSASAIVSYTESGLQP